VLVATIAHSHLFQPEVDPEPVGRIRRGYGITLAIYMAATLIALVAPWVALAIAVRLHLPRIHYQPTAPAP